MLGQYASVQQFHQPGDRPADSALAFFPFADGAKVIDAQTTSEAGLCKPSPLADGFEGGGGHRSNNSKVSHARLLTSNNRIGNLPAKPRRALNGGAAANTGKDVAIDDQLLSCVELAVGCCVYFHSPVSGGARPRCCGTLMRPSGPHCNRESASVWNYFRKHVEGKRNG